MRIYLLSNACALAFALVFGGSALAQETDPVIATIGGKPVYQSELEFAKSDLDPQFDRLPEDQKTAAVLSALIDIKVMAQQAEKAGLGQDEEFARRMAFLKDRTLHNEYFRDRVVEGVTPEEVRKRYDEEIAAIPPEKEVRARHILVDSEEQAKAIVAELDAGADFIELAKEKSTGPSGPDGGDLGFFSRGRMVPEFETAAFALEPGTYTKEPVKSQFGWHIIKVEDIRDMAPPTFEQVAEQIQRLLVQERYLQLIQEARESIEVEVTDPALKALLDAASQTEAN